MIEPPYPADTRAKGWRFELDYEQIEQSGTWSAAMAAALDGLPLARPFLLAMWYAAWKQVPCGSLPSDDRELAGAIGIPSSVFAEYRAVLLRGWWQAKDGRLYHPTLTARVVEMMSKRRSDSDRQAARRARDASESGVTHDGVTRDAQVTHAEVGSESSTDHRPPTTSLQDKPVEKKRRGKRAVPPSVSVHVLIAHGFDGDTADEFIVHKHRLGAPLTERAWLDHLSESHKAGWTPLQAAEKVMAKGWKGFEAKYVANEKPGQLAESFSQRAARARVESAVPGLAARPSSPVTEVFDVTARLVG